MVYLYKWYELWIVYQLIKEQQPRSAISAKKMEGENNPALVIVSPSPDPDAVYTIQGQASQQESTQDS